MLRLRLGLNLESLQQPLRQGLESAARLGVEGVEINARTELPAAEMSQTAIRQIRKWLSDRNLRVCSLSYPTRRGYAEATELERRVEGTKAAMRLAYELGARLVVNRLGDLPEDRASPEYRLMREALTDLGQYGMRAGATLAVRTGPQSGDQLVGLLGDLPEGSLAIDFDPAGLIVHTHSPGEAIQALAPWVASVRACDAVRDLSQGRAVAVPLGRGSVDFAELFSVLERQQFSGYILVEGQPPEPEQRVADGIAYLKSLF